MPNLPFEDEGNIYTDERSDAPSKTEKTRERAEDASNPPVDQGLDPTPGFETKPKTRFHQTDQTKTDERENPGQAVRDSYSDA